MDEWVFVNWFFLKLNSPHCNFFFMLVLLNHPSHSHTKYHYHIFIVMEIHFRQYQIHTHKRTHQRTHQHTWKAFRLHLNSIKYIVSMNLPFWFRIAIHFVSMEKSRIATNNAKNCHLLKSFETATAAVALKIELRLWIDSYRCICNGICIHFVFPTSRVCMHKSIEILWRRK